ncbi:integrator complex subunit 3 homolog [Diaphorina citri]|uniref:SOSS complex subunit A homolog n=2 Tax=Diaphorina citri TaxID=121845 RepID=A0A3Q0IZ39_DIACI|nr:integrator complex subunit 3 homolog [Diaphorina citri]
MQALFYFISGRDLVRLLQNVARIPEFEALWRQMIHQPQTLSPKFTGILQILQTRTSRRFLQSRLTPEMERKLVFLTSNVKFGLQKRYQDWFTKQYLSTTESQALRYDVIRFIVGVIHPTNELLCSDIIPRWAVIGWLLTSCTSPVVLANCKLALFYDWLCYDPEKDNIMNIEPAILLMSNSIPKHASITAGLLDFLCRIILNFHPTLTEHIKAGVVSSLHQILEKRVLPLPTLGSVFDSAKLDAELRAMVQDIFGVFCRSPPSPPGPGGGGGGGGGGKEAVFSDDEEDNTPTLNNTNSKRVKPSPGGAPINSAPLPPCSDLLSVDMKSHMSTLYGENDSEVKCLAMERIVELILQEDYEQEILSAVGNRRLVMMKGPGIQTLLQVSLTWETFEQMCLWQLFSAHDIALAQILPILPRLKFSFHAEALSAILLLLKQEKPDEDSLKQVLCREVKPLSDMFVVSILQHWCQTDADLLAEILSDLLSTRCPATSPNKRKRGGQGQGLGAKAGVTPPSAERILGHLERVRYGCKVLFLNTRMQRALHIAQACCTDTQRTLYSNLFALLDEGETSSTTNNCSNQNSNSKSNSNKRGRRVNRSSGGGTGGSSNARNSGGSTGRQSRATSASVVDISSESRSDSSSEEELVKVKPAPKKRKKAPAVLHSDSD